MVFLMQKRVNDRTALYAKHYQGEQVPKATSEREKQRYEGVAKELKELSSRQERLSKVTKELSTQAQRRQ